MCITFKRFELVSYTIKKFKSPPPNLKQFPRTETPLKMMKILFILSEKLFFFLRFLSFNPDFWSCRETTRLET